MRFRRDVCGFVATQSLGVNDRLLPLEMGIIRRQTETHKSSLKGQETAKCRTRNQALSWKKTWWAFLLWHFSYRTRHTRLAESREMRGLQLRTATTTQKSEIGLGYILEQRKSWGCRQLTGWRVAHDNLLWGTPVRLQEIFVHRSNLQQSDQKKNLITKDSTTNPSIHKHMYANVCST